MIAIDLVSGQDVWVGPYNLRVVAVRSTEVVVALFDPEKDCAGCGQRAASRSRCPVCQGEVMFCPDCIRSCQCPQCGCPE
jgi:hypothetical protein